MCGRFTIYSSPEVIQDYFELTDLYPFIPSYNVAPSQTILAVRETENHQRVGVPLRWGLIPSWMKEENISSKLTNARVETVHEKPSFRKGFKSRRCLVVADGYYEWNQEITPKQPYYIHTKDNQLLAFAGIWEHWQNDEGKNIESCAIMTQDANQQLSQVHSRMPVIIDHEHFKLWLDTNNQDVDKLRKLLSSIPYPTMTVNKVSSKVNNPRFNSPECIINV